MVNMCKIQLQLMCVVALISQLKVTAGLECFTCSNINNIAECHTSASCSGDEHCFTTTTEQGSNTVFSLGCKNVQQCLATSMIGRSTNDILPKCSQCCATDYCNKNICNQATEVHGGWYGWSSWGSCSVTCGVGLERRERSCFNVCLGPQENPCFGDTRDYRVCLLKGCTDGNWSTWSDWSTCQGGLKVKHRTCDSPAPSVLGKTCEGNNQVSKSCNIKSRPISLVYFTVTTPNNQLIESRPVFIITEANVGGGYNITSAQFTCPVAGLYQFSFTFLAKGSNNDSTFCWFRKNTSNWISNVLTVVDSLYKSASGTVFVQLSVGDVFDVGACAGWNYVEVSQTTQFTGALVQPL